MAALVLTGTVPTTAARSATRSCSALSSSGIVFSAYDTVSKAAVDGVGTITFTCTGTGTDTLNITLSGGIAGTCSPRQMRNGTLPLSYNIFRESTRTTTWCDSSARLDVAMNYSTGATQTRTVTLYGRVTAGQTPTWGNYTDSLTMQLKQGGGTLRSSTVSVSGSVSPTCSVSAGTLSFASYTGTAAVTSTANISVNCSNGAGYQVSLGGGQHLTGSTRRMLGPSSNYLTYELHRDAARTLPWGDSSVTGSTVSGTGTGSAQAFVAYGRIPTGQIRAVGSYTDSVIVTVEY